MSGTGEWGDWIGREERREDILTPSLAARWCATFDRDMPSGLEMPQAIHLCLCPPDAATAQLGEDGHPSRGDDPAGFLPPIPLPRRMWTGSTMTFHAPIRIGSPIVKRSTIGSIEPKQGKRGAMVFVGIDHTIFAEGKQAVLERQTLVYLEAVAPDAPPVPPEPTSEAFDADAWDETTMIRPDERLLFRYSALTFNTHRIHYDARYARAVERYRGLVVHGPLLATLLLRFAQNDMQGNALSRFAFKAVSPAIAGEPLHLAVRREGMELALGAFAEDGRQVIEAQAAMRA